MITRGSIEEQVVKLGARKREMFDQMITAGEAMPTQLTPEDIPDILASGDRSLAGPTVPPGGLYMTRLWYEDERLNE